MYRKSWLVPNEVNGLNGPSPPANKTGPKIPPLVASTLKFNTIHSKHPRREFISTRSSAITRAARAFHEWLFPTQRLHTCTHLTKSYLYPPVRHWARDWTSRTNAGSANQPSGRPQSRSKSGHVRLLRFFHRGNKKTKRSCNSLILQMSHL